MPNDTTSILERANTGLKFYPAHLYGRAADFADKILEGQDLLTLPQMFAMLSGVQGPAVLPADISFINSVATVDS